MDLTSVEGARGRGRAARLGRTPFVWSLEETGPFDLKADEVLVEVAHCGICGSDVHRSISTCSTDSTQVTPGHEVAGTVVGVGSAVQRVTIGERVCVDPLIPCLKCAACNRGQVVLCETPRAIGQDVDGGFADYLVIPQANVYRTPSAFTWEQAALIEPLTAAIHALTRAQIERGDTMMIIGAGSMGLLTALTARKLFEVRRLIMVAKYEHQADFAARLDVDAVIAYEPRMQNVVSQVQSLTDGEMATVVIQAAGGSDVADISTGCQVLSNGGRLVILGRVMCKRAVDFHLVMKRQLSIIGSHGANAAVPEHNLHDAKNHNDFVKAVDFCQRLDQYSSRLLTSMVTHKFPLEDIGEAFKAAAHKAASRSIKVQLMGKGIATSAQGD